MKAYRNNLQIVGTVLQATQDTDRDGIPITQLITKSNLSHPRLTVLLDKLVGKGLINKIQYDGKNTFVITESGILYLEEYRKFQSFTNSFGLEL